MLVYWEQLGTIERLFADATMNRSQRFISWLSFQGAATESGDSRVVSNKQNEKEEPGESGLPCCSRNIGSQTVFGAVLEIGDKYFAVSAT